MSPTIKFLFESRPIRTMYNGWNTQFSLVDSRIEISTATIFVVYCHLIPFAQQCENFNQFVKYCIIQKEIKIEKTKYQFVVFERNLKSFCPLEVGNYWWHERGFWVQTVGDDKIRRRHILSPTQMSNYHCRRMLKSWGQWSQQISFQFPCGWSRFVRRSKSSTSLIKTKLEFLSALNWTFW